MTTWEKVQRIIDRRAAKASDKPAKDLVNRKDLFTSQRTNSDTTKVSYAPSLWGFRKLTLKQARKAGEEAGKALKKI